MALDLDTPTVLPRAAAAAPGRRLRTAADSGCRAGSLLLESFQPQHASGSVDARVPYCLYGSAGKPVVAVLGGISASRWVLDSPDGSHAGWWRHIVGRGLGVDTDDYRVLS